MLDDQKFTLRFNEIRIEDVRLGNSDDACPFRNLDASARLEPKSLPLPEIAGVRARPAARIRRITAA